MKKRNLRIIIALLVLTGLIVALLQFVRFPFVPINAFQAVPQQTSVLFEWANPTDIEPFVVSQKNLFFSEKVADDWDVFQQTFNWQQEAPLLCALQLISATEFDFIYILNTDKHPDLTGILDTLTTNKTEAFIYQGQNGYTLQNTDNQQLSITQFRNLLIFARRRVLVEEAINQLNNFRSNVTRSRPFRQMQRGKDSGSPLHMYVHFDGLSEQFSGILLPNKRAEIDRFNEWVKWLKIDIQPTEKGFDLHGTLSGVLKSVKRLEPLEDDAIFKVMPDHIAVATWLQAPESKHISTEFAPYFQPWMQREVVYAITEPLSANADPEKFVVLRVRDMEAAKQNLDALADKVGVTENYDYNMYPIRQLVLEDMLLPVFGKSIQPIKNPYYTLLDGYAVFANSKPALEIWLDKYTASQTLSNSDNFLQVNASQNKEKQIYFYLNVSKLDQLLATYLRPALRSDFVESFAPYEQLNALEFNFESHNKHRMTLVGNTLKTTQNTSINTPISTQTEVVWKAELNNEAAIPPTTFFNKKTGKYNVFIQDIDHRIYCFSNAGKLLWKKRLGGQILSSIFVLNNDKNEPQLLFNTADNILKINGLNGGDTPNFPLNLQSPATNGLNLIHFNSADRNNFFIACKNQNVYGYTAAGLPISGWTPQRNVGSIAHPIQHFQTEDKDFIFALNQKGQLKVFQHDGSERFPVINFKEKFLSAPAFSVNDDRTRIVALNRKGKIHVVNTEGKTFKLNTDIKANNDMQFIFEDVIGDSEKDYIALTSRQLATYFYEGKVFKKGFEYTFDKNVDEVFVTNFSTKKQPPIGALAIDARQIYLLNNKGELHPDFPLGGTTPFEIVDLFGDNTNALLVGNGASLYVYRLAQ